MFLTPASFWFAMSDGPPPIAASAGALSSAGIVLGVLLVLAVAVIAAESHGGLWASRLSRRNVRRRPLSVAWRGVAR